MYQSIAFVVGAGLILVCLQYISPIIRRQLLMHRHGCTTAPKLPQRMFQNGSDFKKEFDRRMAAGEGVHFQKENLLSKPGRTATVEMADHTWMFTGNAENIKAIMTTQAPKMHTEPLRRDLLVGWVGEGMFASDGENWHRARNMFKPMFARSAISQLGQFEKHVDRFFDLLPEEDVTVDVQARSKQLFLDVESEIMWGQSADSQIPGHEKIDVERFQSSFEGALMGAVHKMFRMGNMSDKTWHENCDFVHSVFDAQTERVLQERRQTGKASDASMLHSLVEVSQDKVWIRDQLINVFIGGEAPGPIGIAVVVWFLARHPEVYQKLRNEVLAIGDQPVTFELLKSLKYTQNAISETLRLHSPVNIVPRLVKEDCILPRGGGPDGQQPVFVAKGTRIDVSLGVLHQDTAFWGRDAEEFRPERWEGLVPKWQYSPFLGGPRICPAMQMILTQYAFMLVKLARRCSRIENRDPVKEFEAQIIFSQQSRRGVKVALYR